MALPAHREHELAYLCQHSEARALAVPGVLRDFDHQDLAGRLMAGSATLRHILVAGQDVRHTDLTALCAEPEPAPSQHWPATGNAGTPPSPIPATSRCSCSPAAPPACPS